MLYTVGIKFESGKHCLECPLRDVESDSCRLQVVETRHGNYEIEFSSWEEQMKKCPLTEQRSEDIEQK